MSDKRNKVKMLCGSAIQNIDEAIAKHQRGEPAALSLPLLNTVRVQVEQMGRKLNPASFVPTYARFVMDWPDECGLVRQLTELAYEYGRIQE